MRKKIIFTLLSFILLFVIQGRSQSYRIYPNPANISVLNTNGDTFRMPFSGGLLNPQFSAVDLNGDGLMDIFAFEPTDNKVLTFINIGLGKYQYAPEYESLFPPMQGWAILADYNKDGKPDIFTNVPKGMIVYKNTAKAKGPVSFQKMTNLLYYRDIGYDLNLYAGIYDIPCFTDIDGDGEMDILTIDINQYHVQYFRNTRKDKGLPNDSLSFAIVDRCWGKFTTTYGDTVQLNTSCGHLKRSRSRHGATGILALDLDGDGDKDLLFGNIYFGAVDKLTNGRINNGKTLSKIDTMIAQDTLFPKKSEFVNLPFYPVPFQLDANGDGLQDLVFTPQSQNESVSLNQIWLYLNKGTNSKPVYEFSQSDFLQMDMMDFGTHAAPAFWDYDGDGKMDLLIAVKGNPDVPYLYDKLVLYKNIGTATHAIYKMVSNDFAGASSLNEGVLRPAIGDIDGDGKQDLLLGDIEGKIIYYKNTGMSGGIPQMSLVTTSYANIQEDTYSAPALADLDADGKLDLVIGKSTGSFAYYHNNGTKTSPDFVKVTDSLGQVVTNEYYYDYTYDNKGHLIDSVLTPYQNGHSCPWIADLDGDGKLDMISGSTSGKLLFYMDIASKLKSKFVLADTMLYNSILGHGENRSFGELSVPCAVDLNGDGKAEILIGNNRGGITSYGSVPQKPITVGIEEIKAKHSPDFINVYPNPASGQVFVDFIGQSGAGADISLYDLLGQMVYHQRVSGAVNNVKIDVLHLTKGIYILEVHNGENVADKKLILK